MRAFTDSLLGRTGDPRATGVAGSVAAPGPAPLWAKAAGALALLAAMSFLTALGLLYRRGTGETSPTLLALFALVAAAAALAAAVIVGRAARTASLGSRDLPLHFAGIWRDATGWTMFLLGCVLTLPAFTLFTRVLAGDSDSARLVASLLYVQQNGFDYLVETQEVLLPHILLSPILAVGGIPALQLFDVLSVVLLGGVVAFLAWRLTRSPLVVLATVLALNSLPAILDRAYRLPMYPTMLAFGFLGVYLSRRAMVAETRSERWRNAALAALCLVLSFESHQVGQLFLVLTALLLVTARAFPAVTGLARVYLVVALLSIPRLAINLAEGGFSHLISNRVDYWVTNGYLKPIQIRLFYLPVGDTLGEYVEKAPDGIFGVWGSSGLLALALGLVGFVAMNGRLRSFALACTGFVLAVALYRRLPFYTRYFSVFLVGSALAAGLAFGLLRSDSRARRAAIGLVLAGLLASACASYVLTIGKVETLGRAVASGPYKRFVNEMSPGDGVIGTRSVYLDFVSSDVRTYGGQFLTEREYVTFLTWPSDQAVIEVMRRHDIQWVFVPSEAWKWVKRYNDIWLLPAHGKAARYHHEVKRSPAFCRAKRSRGAALYKLDPLGPGEAVPTGLPRPCDTP